jgi:hypothetical protein
MLRFRLLSRFAVIGGLATVTMGAAHAQSFTAEFLSTTPSGSNLIYNYELVVGSQTVLNNNAVPSKLSQFTFFDFAGLTGTPTFVASGPTGVDFAITTPLTGNVAPNTNIGQFDDPTLRNVSLAYDASTPYDNTSSSDVIVGTLSIPSTDTALSTTTVLGYSSVTTSENGTKGGNSAFVEGPDPAALTTPEPGTEALLIGLGITALGVLRRNRRTRR